MEKAFNQQKALVTNISDWPSHAMCGQTEVDFVLLLPLSALPLVGAFFVIVKTDGSIVCCSSFDRYIFQKVLKLLPEIVKWYTD